MNIPPGEYIFTSKNNHLTVEITSLMFDGQDYHVELIIPYLAVQLFRNHVIKMSFNSRSTDANYNAEIVIGWSEFHKCFTKQQAPSSLADEEEEEVELPKGSDPILTKVPEEKEESESEKMQKFFFKKKDSGSYRKCECGLDASGVDGKHSSWCPKAIYDK